jgi:ferrous iron transport protein A
MDVSGMSKADTDKAAGTVPTALLAADRTGAAVPCSPAACDPELCATCTLADARAGEHFIVTNVDDEQARVTALRFGMAEGACVHCVTRIPAGPIVLRAGRQEIAVGRELAKRIGVRADTKPE